MAPDYLSGPCFGDATPNPTPPSDGHQSSDRGERGHGSDGHKRLLHDSNVGFSAAQMTRAPCDAYIHNAVEEGGNELVTLASDAADSRDASQPTKNGAPSKVFADLADMDPSAFSSRLAPPTYDSQPLSGNHERVDLDYRRSTTNVVYHPHERDPVHESIYHSDHGQPVDRDTSLSISEPAPNNYPQRTTTFVPQAEMLRVKSRVKASQGHINGSATNMRYEKHVLGYYGPEHGDRLAVGNGLSTFDSQSYHRIADTSRSLLDWVRPAKLGGDQEDVESYVGSLGRAVNPQIGGDLDEEEDYEHEPEVDELEEDEPHEDDGTWSSDVPDPNAFLSSSPPPSSPSRIFSSSPATSPLWPAAYSSTPPAGDVDDEEKFELLPPLLIQHQHPQEDDVMGALSSPSYGEEEELEDGKTMVKERSLFTPSQEDEDDQLEDNVPFTSEADGAGLVHASPPVTSQSPPPIQPQKRHEGEKMESLVLAPQEEDDIEEDQLEQYTPLPPGFASPPASSSAFPVVTSPESRQAHALESTGRTVERAMAEEEPLEPSITSQHDGNQAMTEAITETVLAEYLSLPAYDHEEQQQLRGIGGETAIFEDLNYDGGLEVESPRGDPCAPVEEGIEVEQCAPVGDQGTQGHNAPAVADNIHVAELEEHQTSSGREEPDDWMVPGLEGPHYVSPVGKATVDAPTENGLDMPQFVLREKEGDGPCARDTIGSSSANKENIPPHMAAGESNVDHARVQTDNALASFRPEHGRAFADDLQPERLMLMDSLVLEQLHDGHGRPPTQAPKPRCTPRSKVRLVPNPKRSTVASQKLQEKKLAKPFKCPTITASVAKPSATASTLRVKQLRAESPSHASTQLRVESPSKGGKMTQEDTKTKHRTARASAQFKSPLAAAPVGEQALVRPTPTIQTLERRLQTLKRALKVVRENEEKVLESLVQKWTEAGREIAYEVWTVVKGGTAAESDWGSGGNRKGKRKMEEGWGWDEGPDSKKKNQESWGCDAGSSDAEEGYYYSHGYDVSGDTEEEAKQDSIGTMLAQFGICPDTLGWNEDEGCFTE